MITLFKKRATRAQDVFGACSPQRGCIMASAGLLFAAVANLMGGLHV